MVNANAVPVFIALLHQQHDALVEQVSKHRLSCYLLLLMSSILQALWVLGNIAGDCSQYRDLCLETGVIEPLTNLLVCNAFSSF